jgi:hypothetical protein
MRFPIRFDRWYRGLSTALWLRPADSYVDVDGTEVEVRMGWAFRARFARGAVATVRRMERAPLSRGVHGLAGRWLVNGSGQGVLALQLDPTQRARVLGVPVKLRELMVSVDDPEGLTARLRG